MTDEHRTGAVTDGRAAGAPWSQAAENRAAGSGGSRMVARLLTPALAVVPWLVMTGGILFLLRASRAMRLRFEPAWGELVGGVVLVLLSALLWAALTAWSSVGTTVAGLCTIALGLATATHFGMRTLFRLGREGPVPLQELFYGFATPTMLVPLGALLLAAGLGAAGARRRKS